MKIEIKNCWTGEVIFSAEADSVKAAVLLAVEADANLRGANLREANLCEADLSGADLSEADLSEANLSEADLRGADLRGADLSEADLRGANLRGANLCEADLSEADLRYANLNHTNIPLWCGTLKGVKVDIRLVRQIFLHIFALECEDKTFRTIKRLIKPFAKLSDKWHHYEEKQKGE